MPRAKNYNKEEKLQLAVELYWKQGYHATSIQQLVDHLGMNRASIYEAFGSKKGLFMQAISAYTEQESKRMADFLYQFINVRQGVYELFEAEVNSVVNQEIRRGCFWINAVAEIANLDSEIKSLLEEGKSKFEMVFFNYLQYGVNQGQVSSFKDVSSLVSFYLAIYSGLKTNSKLNHKKEDLMNTVSIAIKALD